MRYNVAVTHLWACSLSSESTNILGGFSKNGSMCFTVEIYRRSCNPWNRKSWWILSGGFSIRIHLVGSTYGNKENEISPHGNAHTSVFWKSTKNIGVIRNSLERKHPHDPILREKLDTRRKGFSNVAVLKRYVIDSADFNSSSLCKNILVTIQHLDFLIKLDHKLKFEKPTGFFFEN